MMRQPFQSEKAGICKEELCWPATIQAMEGFWGKRIRAEDLGVSKVTSPDETVVGWLASGGMFNLREPLRGSWRQKTNHSPLAFPRVSSLPQQVSFRACVDARSLRLNHWSSVLGGPPGGQEGVGGCPSGPYHNLQCIFLATRL